MKGLKIIGIVCLILLAIISGIYILGRDGDRNYPETVKAELTDVDGVFDTVLDASFLAPLFKEGYLEIPDQLVNSVLYHVMVTEKDMLDTEQLRVNYIYTDFQSNDLIIKAHVDLKSPMKYPTSIEVHLDLYGQGNEMGAVYKRAKLGNIPIPKFVVRLVLNRPEVQSLLSLYLDDMVDVDYEMLSASFVIDDMDGYFNVNEVDVDEGHVLLYGQTSLMVSDLLERQSVPETYLELADLIVGTLSTESLTDESTDMVSDEGIVLSGLENAISQSQSDGLESLMLTDLAKVYFTLEGMDEDSYNNLLISLDDGDQMIVKLLVEELRDLDYQKLLNQALDSIL